MGSVLIIGESEMNRAAIIDVLDDYHVVEANDIYEASKKTQERNSDFIAVIYDADCMEDGTKLLLRTLKERGNATDIKTIALLTKECKFTAKDVTRSGADRVFVRPFDISRLRDYVTDCSVEAGF